MRRLLPALLTATALLVLPGVAAAASPVPATTAPTAVTLTGATLNGTVNPGGESTDVRFRVDDDPNFGSPLSTITAAQSPLTASGSPVAVSAAITGLTTGTTYYFRVEADNTTSTDFVSGASVSFVPSAVQQVTTGIFTYLTSSTVRLSGAVTPNGLATQARFRYGTSPNSQKFTPVVAVGSGTTSVPFEADLTSLPANTRIYYTLRTDRAGVAADAVEGTQRSFVTGRALTGLTATAKRIQFGSMSTVSGNLAGSGIVGATVVAQIQRYPFTEPFRSVASARTTTSGRYAIRLPRLYGKTRVRVSTAAAPILVSPTRTINVEPVVGLIIRRQGNKRVFAGSIRPRLEGEARARIQRKIRGRWVTIRALRLTSSSSTRSSYTTTLLKRSQRTSYRVRVSHSRPELATGISRTRTLG